MPETGGPFHVIRRLDSKSIFLSHQNVRVTENGRNAMVATMVKRNHFFKSQTKWNGLFYCFIMMLGINGNVVLVVVVEGNNRDAVVVARENN